MQDSKSKILKVAISTGEVSGDQHAARILSELQKNENYTIQCKAMGGAALEAQGAEIALDIRDYAGFNGFNLFRILGKSYSALRQFKILLKTWRPDVLLVVDYPDYHFFLIRIASMLKIPVVYFIPPKVWAWRKKRVKVLKKYCSEIALIFPFEEKFYAEHKVNQAHFVGHPFTESITVKNQVEREELKKEICKQLELNPDSKIVCIMPGSRKSEITRHFDVALEAFSKMQKETENLQGIIVQSPNNPLTLSIPSELRDSVRIYTGNSHDILQIADVGILKSGTCNLEAAFYGLPFVCYYIVPKITAWIIRRFVELKEYSPVNIIKSASVKELMQEAATADGLAQEAKQLLNNEIYRQKKLKRFSEIVSSLKNANQSDSKTYNESSSIAAKVSNLIIKSVAKRKTKSSVKRLISYIKPYKGMFFMSLVCMVIFGATDGGIPLLVKQILDGVFAKQNEALLWSLPIILIAFALIRGLSELGQEFLLAKVGHYIVRDLRNQSQEVLLKVPPGFFIQNSVGDLLARFTSDVVLVRELLTRSVAALIRDSIRILALLTSAIYLDPFLAMIAFLVFPIGIFPVYRFGKRMRKLSKQGQDSIGAISSLVQECVLGNKVVRAFGRENYEIEKFRTENEALTKTFIKSEKVRGLTGPVNELLAVLAISAIILYGGYSVIGGLRSQGEFIAFLISVFLLYDPFKKLSKLNNQIQQGLSGADRVFDLLDQKNPIADPAQPTALPNNNTIKINNVCFNYTSDNEQITLADINIEIKEGSKIALVGFSGSGKSTLVDLIPRFMDPNSGSIEIGGINIKEFSIKDLRSRIALVTQHTFLFNDTVYNNIAYGKENASETDIINAAKAAFAYDFIMDLPDKFQTILGESGLSLSGGERQRLAIARAILKNAPILILDEATASLDNRAEREVQAALTELENGRTSIIIAHRLSTIHNADCIYVMEQGRVVESGTHDQLLKLNSAYAKLHNLQFSKS